MASTIDSLLDGTGLSGHGGTILEYALEFGVNPAFALAMFREEAEFAKPGSIANRQNNPGNIICGGGTTPLYGATGCGGRFGIYDTMADGIKAYFWLLDSEYKPGREYDCEDIPCIISVYCPPSDCDTARYTDQVVQWTIQYQSRLSAQSPLVLQPAPTVPPVAITVVPATVIPQSPKPAVPPTPGQGRIAFMSLRDANYEIYVMNADGSAQANLTNNPAHDMYPAWSPDGTRIAFVSGRNDDWGIYIMNSNGGAATWVTGGLLRENARPWGGDLRLSWSPDGARIAFVSQRDGNFEVYVMNVDGSAQTNLTRHPASDTSLSWSADGKHIAFESYRNGGGIYVMNSDGGGLTKLTSWANDAYPCWSPDSRWIAFMSDGEIYVIGADGSRQTALTNHAAYDKDPSWSPDGMRIAFASERDGNYEICTMNADGSDIARLTTNPSTDCGPSWSPM